MTKVVVVAMISRSAASAGSSKRHVLDQGETEIVPLVLTNVSARPPAFVEFIGSLLLLVLRLPEWCEYAPR